MQALEFEVLAHRYLVFEFAAETVDKMDFADEGFAVELLVEEFQFELLVEPVEAGPVMEQ